jgi:dienelactone hydrolase
MAQRTIGTEQQNESEGRPARIAADGDRASGAPLLTKGRVGVAVLLASFALAALLLARLSGQQDGGPPHLDVIVGDGIPLTLYVPGHVADRDVATLPDPAPEGRRPPVVVLAHGFSADRALMSTLARSLAAHGYAVAAPDFRGHGQNRNGFTQGELRDDLAAVVDWLETEPHIDPDRLVVMGHSMGAGAVLDFATHDPRPVAVVPISGGWEADGPERPASVFFVVAENDPGRIATRQAHLADRLRSADVDVAEAEIGGTDHLTVLYADATVNRIVTWLDGVTGHDGGTPRGRVDDRLGTTGLYLLVALVLLAAIGVLVGRLAPRTGDAGPRAPLGGLVVVFAALLAVGPAFTLTSPGGFLTIPAGGEIVVHGALAGGALLVARALRRRGALAFVPAGWLAEERVFVDDPRRAAGAALAGAAGVYLLLSPIGPVFHNLVPTPGRLVAVVVVAALFLPLFVALDLVLRRGPTVPATLQSLGGRVLIVLAVALAVRLGTMPGVVSLMLPLVAMLFLILEIAATAAYATGRNTAAIAGMQALVLGWITATALPFG